MNVGWAPSAPRNYNYLSVFENCLFSGCGNGRFLPLPMDWVIRPTQDVPARRNSLRHSKAPPPQILTRRPANALKFQLAEEFPSANHWRLLPRNIQFTAPQENKNIELAVRFEFPSFLYAQSNSFYTTLATYLHINHEAKASVPVRLAG